MQYRKIVCPICSGADTKVINTCKITKDESLALAGQDLTLAQCKSCALVYVNPQPVFTAEEISALYNESYFSNSYMRFYCNEDFAAVQSNEPFEFRLGLIHQYKRKGRLLEVGCASGGFLNHARAQGWDVLGVDISEYALNSARERYRIPVFCGDLKAANFPQDSVDVICLADVLEHISAPADLLKEAGRILKNNGVLYIAVPDFGSLHYSLKRILARFTHRNYFVLPHHLFHFTSGTLAVLLRENGFVVKTRLSRQSRHTQAGLKGLVIRSLYNMAEFFNFKDRIIVIASKRE